MPADRIEKLILLMEQQGETSARYARLAITVINARE